MGKYRRRPRDVNQPINHMVDWNLIDVFAYVDLKFPAVLKFPAWLMRLKFPAE